MTTSLPVTMDSKFSLVSSTVAMGGAPGVGRFGHRDGGGQSLSAPGIDAAKIRARPAAFNPDASGFSYRRDPDEQ
jgi:hypothetical protein